MELNLSNSFAALEVRKATKRKDDGNKKKRHAARQEHNLKLEQAIFGKKLSNVSDWADDEWGEDSTEGVGSITNGNDLPTELQSEEEIDLEEHFGVELGPEDDHEDHEDLEEKEKQDSKAEPSAEELALLEEHRKKYHVEPQRKVSKKELKKKEMEDLDGLLADLGIEVQETKNQESSGKKKKRKPKDKGGAEERPGSPSHTPTQEATGEDEEDEQTTPKGAPPKAILNKLEKGKSTKKRPSNSKKSVEIAAAEAKARMKGKKGKKDTAHFNQAPNH